MTRAIAFATVALLAACTAAVPPRPQLTERLPYAVIAGDTLWMDRFSPSRTDTTLPSRRPAVLLLHGGGWTDGEPSWVHPAAAAFAAAGFEAFAVQYRLSDSVTTPTEALADVCTALRWTRLMADSLDLDAERVAIYGVSAGGHLAASTVTVGCPEALGERGADALLLLSPAVDVERDGHFVRLLRDRATARDLSPVANPGAAMPPTVLIQGAEDSLTPLAGAQRFCLLIAAQRQLCDLRVYDGLGHLLTRDLSEQQQRFDPDPAARADALQHQVTVLRRLWLPDPS